MYSVPNLLIETSKIIRIRSLSKQEGDVITSKDILTQEYETESHRLNSKTRSQDEIKRLTDQLDENEVRLSHQTLLYDRSTTND